MAVTVGSVPQLDLTVQKGSHFSFDFQLTTTAGAYNYTGTLAAAVKCQFRLNDTAATLVATPTVTIITAIADTITIRLTLTGTQTAAIADSLTACAWDLLLQLPGASDFTRLVRGRIIFVESVSQ